MRSVDAIAPYLFHQKAIALVRPIEWFEKALSQISRPGKFQDLIECNFEVDYAAHSACAWCDHLRATLLYAARKLDHPVLVA